LFHIVLPIGGRVQPKLKLILMTVFAASNANRAPGLLQNVMQGLRQLFDI
jgi:hypothetical protein